MPEHKAMSSMPLTQEDHTANQIPLPQLGLTNETLTGRPDPVIERGHREAGTLASTVPQEPHGFLDRDARARSTGLRTTGRVIGGKTREHTDGEGGTHCSYHVTYEYKDGGSTHTAERRVDSYGNLRRGDSIKVYLLLDTYPPATAIDLEPHWDVSMQGQVLTND